MEDFENMNTDLEKMALGDHDHQHHEIGMAIDNQHDEIRKPKIAKPQPGDVNYIVNFDYENYEPPIWLDISLLPDVIPDLPDEYKEIIKNLGGCASDAVLVMQRPLIYTDIVDNVFSMPGKRTKSMVLTESEYQNLRKFDFLEVLLLEPSLDVSYLYFEQAGDTCCLDPLQYDYCLADNWSKVVKNNDLQVGMNVQLWSFRLTPSNDLCFALVVL